MLKLKPLARAARDAVYRVLYKGTGRWCPVCEKPSRRFRAFGVVTKRADAQCVHCGALERHRFLWLFWTRSTDLFHGRAPRFLHIAPEPCFEHRLRARLGKGYLTADLENPADVRMDITDIKYSAESFDVVYCSHVLEHVPDDRKAMREFHRVLAKDGWAIILVPIMADFTHEDPNETDPKERLRRFGQDDHYRVYGPDFVDRLRAAGFEVKVVRVADLVDDVQAKHMGLTEGSGDIYYCTK